MSEGNLTRSDTDKMIAGVCGGIAAYLGIDSVLVRLLFVLLALATGIGIFIYVVLWIIMPGDRLEDQIRMGDEAVKETPAGSNGRKVDQSSTIGLMLIIFGAFFLLKQMGLFAWISSGVFWGVIIMAIGIFFLVRR